MWDRYAKIIADAQIPAAILGNPAAREFVLVDLALGRIPDCLYGRGLVLVGVTGIVNGVPQAALAVELEDSALSAIAAEWTRYLVARIMPYMQLPVEESMQFLERLYALEDTRKLEG